MISVPLKGEGPHLHGPAAALQFYRARPDPFAQHEKMEQALDHIVEKGTTGPVQFSQWATPIVPVVKTSIRRDCKLTVNKTSRLAQYPLPNINELFMKLVGGMTFTELDLSQSYEQMLLDEESQGVVTINNQSNFYSANIPGKARLSGVRQLNQCSNAKSLKSVFNSKIEETVP